MPRRFWTHAVIVAVMASTAWAAGLWGLAPALVAGILALVGLVLALGLVAFWDEAPGPPHEPQGPEGVRRAPPGIDRALLEHLPTPIFLIEPGGRIGYANEAARERFPLRVESPHFASLLRAPAFVEAVNRGFETGQAQVADFTTFHGQEVYLRAHVCPSQAQGAGPILVLIEDHTGDRRVERLRADFVANASHELRTPLASLIGYIETLQGPARDDPPAQARFLGIMARQAERMKRLVDDLLSLNQIEMNEHLAPRTLCALHEIVREAASSLAPIAAKRGVELKLELAGEEATVRGDRDQLVQVFVNLIDNAIKYGGPRGPVVVAAARPDPRYPGMTGVSVTDRGAGIPREHVPRLTERFYRVSVQASREKGGTGLGLAIVKHVLNRHRGELQIESTIGVGSRFTVWLPRLAMRSEAGPPPPASGKRPAPPPAPGAGQGRHTSVTESK